MYISVQIGDPEIVNYFQVIESYSSCLDKFERGFTNSFIFEKSTSNYYLSNPIRVILTKPFYYCHSTGVVENKRRRLGKSSNHPDSRLFHPFHPSRILPSKVCAGLRAVITRPRKGLTRAPFEETLACNYSHIHPTPDLI